MDRPRAKSCAAHQPGRVGRRFALRPVSVAVCLVGVMPAAFGLPEGAMPSFGQTTVAQTAAGQLTIVQSSQRAGLDWTSFSIAAGETVRISQPNGSAVLLNRVLGNDPSLIYGRLQANGNVWLVNPRGIMFGASSQVDVGGLLASTLSITGEPGSGRLQLGRGSNAAGELRSEGLITAPNGSVVLVAPRLSHSGRIEAARVGLAAASEVLVDVEGDGLVFFNVRNDGLEARLDLLGKVVADGGLADVRAAARAGFADTVLNLEGVVQARTLGRREGRIVIDGGAYGITRLAGRLDATGLAADQRGGDVLLQGAKILLDSAAVADASGAAGGGSVRVGGDFQGANPEVRNAAMLTIQHGAQLSANATEAGHGGRVIAWSDEATRFLGSADTKGGPGGGDGGLVEVSGRDFLDYRGSSDRSAPLGKAGILLLDPTNITVQLAGPDLDADGSGKDLAAPLLPFAPALGTSVITAGAVLTQLAAGSVELQATNDINVNTAIGFSANSTSKLTLRARNDINVSAAVSVAGGIELRANDDATGGGRVAASANLAASSGTVLISTAGANTNTLSAAVTANAITLTGNAQLGASASLSAPTIALTAGTIALAANSQIASGSALIIDGGSLDIAGFNNTVASVSLRSGSIVGSTGVLTSATNFELHSGSVGAILGGAVGLSKTTGGTVTLNADNLYTGATRVAAGVLVISADAQLGAVPGAATAGQLQLAGGRLTATESFTLAAQRGVALDTGASVIEVAAGKSLNIAGIVADGGGAGTWAKSGSGTLVLQAPNSYTGATALTAGTLVLDGAGASAGSGALTVDAATVLDLRNGAVLANSLTLSGGALRAAAGSSAITGTVALNADSSLNAAAGATLTLSNTISGAQSVEKTGDGRVVLSGTNTYAGSTTVSAGTLALGADNVIANGSALVVDGGSFDIGGFNDTVASVSLRSGAITGSTGVLTSAATYDLQNGSVSAILGGSVGLAKTTAGTVTLSGANSYAGSTTVSAGTLALGANNTIANASAVVVDGGSFDIAGFSSTVASVLLLSGSIGGSSGVLTSATDHDLRSGSVGAILGGSVGLAKTTAGTVTLSGANSYSGDTHISAGTLALGASQVIANTSALVIDGGSVDIAGFSNTVASVSLRGGAIAGSTGVLTSATAHDLRSGSVGAMLGGSAGLSKSTTGTVTLSRANTYTGSTTVSAGTLALGANNAISSGSTLVVDGGSFDIAGFNQALAAVSLQSGAIAGSTGVLTSAAGYELHSGSVGAMLGGSAGLTKSTAGTVTLSGANTYSGSTTVNAGTLALGANNTINSSSTLVVDGGNFDIAGFNQALAAVSLQSGTIAGSAGVLTSATGYDLRSGSVGAILAGGGGLTKSTAGTVTLSGTNTYTGSTTVSAGTLALSANNVITNASALVISGGSVDLASFSDTVASVALHSGSIVGSTGVLTSAAAYDLRSGSVSAILGGNVGLTKTTAGTVTLTADNQYTGATRILAGVLAISADAQLGAVPGVASAGHLQLAGGTLALTESFTLAAQRGLARDTGASVIDVAAGKTSSIAGTVANGAGAGALTKTGSGTLVLLGANTSTGTNAVTGGTLALDGVGASAGTGALTIGAAGTLDIRNGGVLNNSLTLDGGALQTSIGSGTITGTVALVADSRLDAAAGATLTLSNIVSGARAIDKLGAGRVVLSGANSYSGSTTVSGGTLALGANNVIANASALVVDGGSLDIAGFSDTVASVSLRHGAIVGSTGVLSSATAYDLHSGSVSAILGGSVGLAKTTAGTVTLSGANSYTGATTVSDGTLALGANNVIANASALVVDGGSISVAGFNDTVASVSLRSGSIVGNTGVLTSATAYELRNGNVNAILGGSVGLTKSTGGTVTLSANNLYTGATRIEAGTLAIAADAGLGAVPGVASAGHLRLAGGTLAATETFTLAARRGVALDTGVSAIDVAAGKSLSIAGVVANGAGAGALAKTGSGTLVLHAPNTYTGATAVNAGTLALDGAGASAGTGALSVDAAAALDIRNGGVLANSLTLNGGALQAGAGGGSITGPVLLNADSSLHAGPGDTLTVSGPISGARALSKTGGGNVVLSGNNSFAGPLTVDAGQLSVQGGAAVADTTAVAVQAGATWTVASAETIASLSGAGAVTLNARLTTGDAGSGSFAGSLSGSAGLVKRGAGSFTLTGDHSYTGPTTVQAGTLLVNGTLASLTLAVDGGALSLGGANRLADSAAVSVASGAMMTLGGADTIGSLLLAGTLNGSFTLSAASYALDGGTVNAQLGAGSLSSTGNSRLNGSAAATSVAVDGGTLTLGAANLLADAAAVSVAGGATLSIQHSDTVGTLALAGTLAGSGTLTASTVTLSGGTVNANLGPGTVASSGSSTLNGLAASDTVTLAGGMLTLGAAHRFSAAPAITVGAGATLSTGTDQVFGSLAGAGNVQLGSAALTTGSAGSSSFAGNLSGSGQLTKTGASTFTLAGANAFSGTANVAAGSLAVDGTLAASVLNINAGSLILGASERLADNAAVTVAAGGTLSLGGSETVGSLVLSGRLDGIGSLTAPTYALSGGTVAAGAHLGAGTLTSSGASQLDGSSGANLVSITSGRLTLGSAERLSNSAAVSVDAGAALRLNGDETVGSITLSGTLDGTGKLTASTYLLNGSVLDIDLGPGELTSTGATFLNGSSEAGVVRVNSGSLTLGRAGRLLATPAVTVQAGATLALGGDETLGTLAGAGTLVLASHKLATGIGGDTTFAGALTGSGQLVKQGSSTFTLSGANSYTGPTTVAAGTLVVEGTLASTTLAVNLGRLVLAAAERLADDAVATVARDAAMQIAGNETVGRLNLAGTLSGVGTLSAAVVALDGGTVNANLGTGALTSTGASRLAGSSAASTVAVNGGTLTLLGAGRWTALPATSVAAGATLALGGDETLGTLAGAGTVALDSHRLSTGAGGDSSFAGVLAGSGELFKQGGSTFTLAGANSYTGRTTVAAGSLLLEGTLASTTLQVDTGSLTLAAADRLADSAQVSVASGAAMQIAGNDTIARLDLAGTLAGSGTLTAATVALAGGTANADLGPGWLSSSGASRLAGSSAANNVAVTGGTLTLAEAGRLRALPATHVAAGATLALGGNEVLGTLAGAGTVALDSHTLSTGAGGPSSFAGVMSGSGQLVKQGSSTFALTGANVHTGSTTVAGGTLQVEGTLASKTLAVDAGLLSLTAPDRLADDAVASVARGAALQIAGSDSIARLDLAGNLAGSGTLTAATVAMDGGTADANLGTGRLTSTGASRLAGSSAAGTVTVTGGTLTLAGAHRLADTASVDVAAGATLALGGADLVGSLRLAGTLGGSGTLTAANYGLAGGTVLADLGSGSLVSTGDSLLAGRVAASSLNVDSGSLTLAAADRLAALPSVTVASGARWLLGGAEAVGQLAGAGSVGLGGATLTVANAGPAVFAGIIDGSGGLHKRGAGMLTLTGAQLYTGLTRIEEGTLSLGDGGTTGSVVSSAFTVDGVLRFERSDAVTLAQAVSGSGSIVQAGSGRLTLQGDNKTHTGATRVEAGELMTRGAGALSAASEIRVAAGARLELAGAESVRTIDADGQVTLHADLAATGSLDFRGGVTVADQRPISLTAQRITATSDHNRWGSELSASSAGALELSSGRDADGVLRDLVLGRVDVGAGGVVDAGKLLLNGALSVGGGSLVLRSSAPFQAAPPDTTVLGKSAAGLPVTFAADVVEQGPDGRIEVATGAGLAVHALNGGSVRLDQAANRFAGSLSVVSGNTGALWAPVRHALANTGPNFLVQSRVRLEGTQIRVGGAGIEADVVTIRGAQLQTVPGSTIVARLPYDNSIGTEFSVPGLTLDLAPEAFSLQFPFGQPGNQGEISINVGGRTVSNPALPLDAGYLAVLPRGGSSGSTAVLLVGPTVASGYKFYFDGAGLQSEIPVFYNGVLPVTPQVSGSISAMVSVSEGARKERFEEAVRTENVATRLRAGVIAEVGPGPSATQGAGGAQPPASCPPGGSSELSCGAAP